MRNNSFMQRLVRITTGLLLVLGALLVGFTAGARFSDSLGFGANGAISPEDSPISQEGTGVEPEAFEPAHPKFDLDADGLDSILQDVFLRIGDAIPEPAASEIISAISLRRETFLDRMAMVLDGDPMFYALADKQTFLPENYEPEDLVSLSGYADQLVQNRNDLSLRAVIMPWLLAMNEAALQDGIVLDLSSTYRSYEYQEGLFQRWVDQLGLEQAERVSARAGTSQHQLGTTVDFGSVTAAFAEHPAGIWLNENAHRFGFSLSYPDGYEELTGYIFEPWHYRYVGPDLIYLQQEFFLDLQQYLMLFMHEAAGDFTSLRRD